MDVWEMTQEEIDSYLDELVKIANERKKEVEKAKRDQRRRR